eukprot:TRINITY_DN32203_c0_g1_i1.p1 TRINITY_DN32203_c0_g1~~TRINITY_DN32203_c0_g1_i1.p1  ORF type:complete len:445 (-),score=95.82 TRINITY_DN32203_c0_g1_i1:330-1664(-)
MEEPRTMKTPQAPGPGPIRDAPTPQRQRTPPQRSNTPATVAQSAPEGNASFASPMALEDAFASAAGGTDGLPQEVRSLSWPKSFLDGPIGERLELSESGALATRTSGINQGIAFTGPFSMEQGTAYFEIEVVELEPSRSSTLAIGVCSALPAAGRVARTSSARDLKDGFCLLGYDLPKIYANGSETKINTKAWRPLKDLTVGTRVGLLISRSAMELTVFVNGEKKVTAKLPGDATGHCPSKLWGVVDVHGTVKAVRLHGNAGKSLAQPREEIKVPPAPPSLLRMASTQEMDALLPSASAAIALKRGAEVLAGGVSSTTSSVDPVPKKRVKLSAHPCGCMVHLIQSSGEVVHVPKEGDFVIGRNPKCTMTLDSADVPNMISRRHAVIVSADDSVMVVDCESVNGTFVNGRRVGRETLRQGDIVVVGNPEQSPVQFRFEVSMPSGL